MNNKILHFPKHFLSFFIILGVIVSASIALHASSCFKVQGFSCSNSGTASLDAIELAPRYYQYSPEIFSESHQKGKVVLYFWAPWCSTCTSLDIELQEKKVGIPEGITVLRLNYDQSAELKAKYGVVNQHTFVQVDRNGQAVATWVGGDIENFSKYLK